ncbi:rhamnan synthesis F family protein [Oxalobacter paraformigenes]|uniref:rhamnan synthesis F family protein n=1 Tax=Oxalobacter paraformigenes TaxID=556268 RepID=UPI000683F366|nr:rhamnan synthesis F family protein [Oxalobacter paraformigenes]
MKDPDVAAFFEKNITSFYHYSIRRYCFFGKTVFAKINNTISQKNKCFLLGLKVYESPESDGHIAQGIPSSFDNPINLGIRKSLPKISVIVDLSDETVFPESTFDALAKQTYKNFDLIVAGNVSSKQITEKLDRFVQENTDIPVNTSKTIESGIEESSGEYIAFCMAEDKWTRDHLEKKVNLIISHENPVIIVNDVKIGGSDEYRVYIQQIINDDKKYFKNKINRIPDELWRANPAVVNPSCCMVKKEAFAGCDLNGYTHHILWYQWLWRQLCSKNNVFYIAEKLTSSKITEEKIKKRSISSVYIDFQLIKGDYLLGYKNKIPVLFPENACKVVQTYEKIKINKKRLAVFASFNREGVVDDYVVYFLRELKKVVDGIVFVTDNPVFPGELDKIQHYIIHAHCERHNEYDFGSYKRGYRYLLENKMLGNVEELVFCNDSCYGPVFPFENMFSAMKSGNRHIDFWGISQSNEIKNHIQSFFYVFKSHVFTNECFDAFLSSVKKESDVCGVILNYEVKFTEYLKNRGFSYDTYVHYDLTHNANISKIFQDKCPLIKLKMLSGAHNKSRRTRERLVSEIEKVNPELYEIVKESVF